VDDNAEVRTAIRSYFQTARFECFDAGSGKEAIQVATRNKPDAVILDFLMPDMSGVATAEALRQIAPGAAIFVFSLYQDTAREAFSAVPVTGVYSKARFHEMLKALRDRFPPAAATP